MQNDERRGRFKSASWYNNDKPLDISIIGLGGIGAILSILLSRLGNHNFYIYDYQTIEMLNMGGQFYQTEDIGRQKNTSTASNMLNFSGVDIVHTYEKFDKNSMVTPYMFSPLDNMTIRKLAFEKWYEEYKESNESMFTDCRMSIESCEVYFVTPDKVEEYRATLFEDGTIPEQLCSLKATSHCGALCASLAVAGFTNYLSNLYTDTDLREVPFKIRVDLPFMSFKLPVYETSTIII